MGWDPGSSTPAGSRCAALEQARAAGIQMILGGVGFGLDGDGWYAYLDAEELLGVTLELTQRPQRRHPPAKVHPA